MLVARTGQCPACKGLDVFRLSGGVWVTDCGPVAEPEVLGLPLPTADEKRALRRLERDARKSLRDGTLRIGSSKRWVRDFYADGHKVFQLPPDHPDYVVTSKKQHEQVLLKHGFDPDTGGLTRLDPDDPGKGIAPQRINRRPHRP